MHKQFTFKNFRGFSDLKVDLKPLTLISGENNTGKTSVLEGLFLFHDYVSVGVCEITWISSKNFAGNIQ